jgi:uncharacterized protein YydD (DUF2326 family)
VYLKYLIISGENGIIRKIQFRNGINLIVDESENQITGNDVGKTTTLMLIDFCLGAEPDGIYLDPETKKNVYILVKNFLIKEKILITLVLSEDINNDNSKEIVIERNFLSRKENIRKINGLTYTENEFETKLNELLFPQHQAGKPSFRQIISHNIRYDDESLGHTLRTVHKYASDAVYETLHLFLLGCEVSTGNLKQELLIKIKQENTFKNRLEKNQTKTAYETALAILDSDIRILDAKKSRLNLNSEFEKDLDNLNNLKYSINKKSFQISKLKLRRDIIIEAKKELEENISNIDLKQLEIIYQQATEHIAGIQKTFNELVLYHNQMVLEKVKFITQELPTLEKDITLEHNRMSNLLDEERRLSTQIAKTSSFEDLEILVSELNEKYRKKGEYESIIFQLKEVDTELEKLNTQLSNIDEELFAESFEQIVKNQRDKFNKYFSAISSELYDEQYALNYNIITNNKGQKLYKFSTFNVNHPNISTGKKQGEISCFEIAYILFAEDENMPCLHFILNDKKELMYGKQLVKIARLVKKHNIQFVASILKDKLPTELNVEEYFILKLSQKDKLFRIENNK